MESLFDIENCSLSEMIKLYGIRYFNANLHLVHKYFKKHFWIFIHALYEQKRAIKRSYLEPLLEKSADAIAKFGMDYVLVMDEIFTKTYNPR